MLRQLHQSKCPTLCRVFTFLAQHDLFVKHFTESYPANYPHYRLPISVCYTLTVAKVYLIGGAPRVGKTTLAHAFIAQKPILATSSDAIRYTLRNLISKSQMPDLFENNKYYTGNPVINDNVGLYLNKIIEYQNKESSIVWKSVVNFIEGNLIDGNDILIEGIAVVPEFVAKLTCEYSVIFLGNQEESHFEIMLNSARTNKYDWLSIRDDTGIKASFLFNKAYSKVMQKEAEKYNMKYLEMSDHNFQASLQEAMDYLK